MAELSKFDELRSKTDKELVHIIGNGLDLGIRQARLALKSADTWDVAERCCLRAKTSYVQVSRLLPLVVEVSSGRTEKRGVTIGTSQGNA